MRRLALALVVLLLAPGAHAQSPDILTRLMKEPVTLFDWGMARLEYDISVAAGQALPRRVGHADIVTGSIYDWRSRLVTIYASARVAPGVRTQQNCVAAFRDIVKQLIVAAPAGSDAEGWYLFNVFKPKSHWLGTRFEDIGAKLLRVVRLEVAFIPDPGEVWSGDTRRVRCTGRLDAAASEISTEVTS